MRQVELETLMRYIAVGFYVDGNNPVKKGKLMLQDRD